MENVAWKRLGWTSSRLGLGAWGIGGQGVGETSVIQGREVLRTYLEAGGNFIDTAPTYGESEELIGQTLAQWGGKAYVATKTKFGETRDTLSRIRPSLEDSLKRLGLDYLDLYLIHMPFGDYYGSWRAMEELYRAGRIRAIGVCNFLPDRLLDFCYNVEIKPQVNQIERHPHYQRAEDLQLMEELGVQPEAWAPFAEGLKGMFEEPVLMEIAAKHQKTPAQILLRWNVQQGVIVIPKSVHRERMEENRKIWDFELDAEDMRRIAELDKNCPSMLDTRKISEIRRVYDYLNNPVLTSL